MQPSEIQLYYKLFYVAESPEAITCLNFNGQFKFYGTFNELYKIAIIK